MLHAKEATASNASVVGQINNLRKEQNLSPLIENYFLNLSAADRACDLYKNQYFSHTDTRGNFFTWWINRRGYKFIYAGENLAKDFANDFQVVQGWKNSPPHFQILVSPKYEEIGVGRCGNYVVAHFGKKQPEYLGFIKNFSEFVSYISNLPELAWLKRKKWLASRYI